MEITQSKKARKLCDCLITTDDALKELNIDGMLQKAVNDELQQQDVACIKSLGYDRHTTLIVKKHPEWKSAQAVRRCYGALAQRAQSARALHVHVYVPRRRTVHQSRMALIGATQGAYRFERYHSEPVGSVLTLVLESVLTPTQFKHAVSSAEAISACRDLINTPAEDMGPEHFVKAARSLARGTGVRVRVMNEAACEKAGMGALLAVGRASPRRPRLLILEAGAQTKDFTALCGKGVCFDTGGLGIKTSKSMELMRKDMGGAATVLCAFIAAARNGLKKPVRVYIPLVENAIDGSAFRPGDILSAMDGTTIEVGHTDAEGRLVLADAIGQARHEGAASVMTVATLTGAALVALGRIHVPIMGNDEAQLKKLSQAADNCGEKAWRLPLDDEHRAIMNTPHADINNSGNGEAGCITAGAFLKHFAHETPFTHCDISPCSWQPKDHELGPVGATGIFVDTLSQMLLA